MTNKRYREITGLGLALPAAAILYAYSLGPDAHHTAIPGTGEPSCNASSGCHLGTPLNGGGGGVKVGFPNGTTYTPGQKQTFTVTITDSAARVYGFQMTARLMSNVSAGQAGTFTPVTGAQIVLCAASSINDIGINRPSSGACPSSKPLEFIEHSTPYKANSFTVAWTPPATASGDIGIFISANAANGDANYTGDHIYTASYTLSAASTGGSAPTVSSVVSASAFNQNAGLASGTWLEIYGANISTSTREWAGGDFNGNNAPTALDGVSVSVNGKAAFVRYISPGQVNVQAPDDSASGDGIPVVVTNAAGSSPVFSMKKSAVAPALLAPSSFNVSGKQYVVAQFADQTFVGKTGLISGVNFRPAKPGDTIIIYGIGFGPVNPNTPAGTIATQSNSLVGKPNFRFGQTPATLSYLGLAPGFVGLYQFNVVVPQVSPGDVQLNVDVGGVALNQNMFVTIGP